MTDYLKIREMSCAMATPGILRRSGQLLLFEMKIFFLTSHYYDLYKPILAELKNRGHQVYLKEDKQLPADYNYRNVNCIVKLFCWFYRLGDSFLIRYWKRQIREDRAYSDAYDFFLCINGVSFHPFLLNHLKKNNPNIRSSLYVWDTSRLYNYFRYNNCFDKVFSFDYEDASCYKDVFFLPSYWTESNKKGIEYQLSIIGSDHDDRLDIVSQVYKQMVDNNLSSFLKIVLKRPVQPDTWYRRILHNHEYKKALCDWAAKKELPYTTEKNFSVDEVIDVIDKSECILDTEMPIQTGASQRVIWALARGKKVISTNKNLEQMPFYDKKQIMFIDRKKPAIDVAFIKETIAPKNNPELLKLRIDNWIKILIS